MPRWASWVAVAGLVVLGSGLTWGCGGGPEEVAQTPPEATDDTLTVCADGSGQLCSVFPDDVVSPGPGYTGLSDKQANFDQFSWQTFVALNWPANGDGTPSSSSILDDATAPRVWQFYTEAGDFFDPDGASACPAEAAPVFDLDSKIDQVGRSTEFSEAFSAPLIDVNGNFAVFDVRMNEVWTSYVTTTQIQTFAQQQAFSGTVSFTQGCFDGSGDCPSGGQVGAIEIKSSWMLVPEGQEADYAADHFTLAGYIALDADETSTGEATCLQRTLALTGMHVVVRTTTDGDAWIWGSFEHVDTAPFATDPLQPVAANTNDLPSEPTETTCTTTDTGTGYSFFNPACTTADGGACPVNTPPDPSPGETDYQWNLATPTQFASTYLVNGFGTQATRCWAIFDVTQATNTTWQGLLAGSVWANYELVGTQWQTTTDTFPAATNRIPAFLANSTMETYFQTSQSCISCHEASTLAGNPEISANFTWLLNREVLDPATGEVAPVPRQFDEVIEKTRAPATE